MTEKLITIFLLLGSIIYLYFAQQLKFGSLQSPKSGFLPVLAGFTAVIIALLLVLSHLRCQKSTKQNDVDWTKFILILIGLLFFIISFKLIGYLAATFIFLLYMFKIGDQAGWVAPIMMAASSSTAFFLIFKYYLAVILP